MIFLYICVMNYYIYTLSDPITQEVRYIGLTTKSLKSRFSAHCSKKNKSYKSNWITSLKRKGLKPIIEVLDTASDFEELKDLEMYWIAQFKQWGFKLLNLTNGGDGALGYKHRKESIELMKQKLLLRPKKPPIIRMTKEEQYAKVSEIKSKKVIEYSLEGCFIKVWKSRILAAKFYNLVPSAIGNALRDYTRHCNGSFWRNYTDNYSLKINVTVLIGNKIDIEVYDLETGLSYTFKSKTEAYKMTGRPTNIAHFINKEKLFKNRYKFIKS